MHHRLNFFVVFLFSRGHMLYQHDLVSISSTAEFVSRKTERKVYLQLGVEYIITEMTN